MIIIYSTFVLLVISIIGWVCSAIMYDEELKRFCIILTVILALGLIILCDLYEIKTKIEQTEIVNKK